MHFRDFLIPALMVGAALFSPGHTFAEKGEPNGQVNSHKEMVQTSELMEHGPVKQTNVPIKVENANPVGKPVTIPESAGKSQSAVKQPPSKGALKRAVPIQAANETVKTLPDRAKGNGYGLSETKNTEKIVNPPGQEKKSVAQEKENGFIDDETEPFVEITVKDKVESTKSVPRFQPHGEDSHTVNTKKAAGFEPRLPVPVKKEKPPSGQEERPAINTVQRSNNSSSPSNDRVSTGVSSISFSDKWFEWNKYVEMKLVQPYLSRYAFMNSQWVNAPPSPPPQDAPFLKTVNRS
ncbi:hypothetical protein J1P26_03275 [Neobacillus sp. MM2021_6]|uniref:hypothetical protein n=1 Tax=Bacillaceae TaxID=186817 RepID=UPI001409B052|nr:MULTISPECIES: hypothetical protein [Bacillaceae]MBO0958742.1 hypothetical protein [Neobacillus sp. MM2021_6]NHC18164.1 hypothetical protein [Bacillus sp. MM2020_4]